jgi:hypothetical protein
LLTVLYKIHFELESKLFASITKYLLIYFALIYLLKKAIDIKSKEHDNNQLEDFEKEIFFENISNEDIVKRFEKNFDGIPFSKWISDKQIEIINFFDHKRKAFFAQDLLLSEVDEIDKNTAPYEFSGRLENIINTQLDILNVTRDFVERISTAFNNLKKFSSLNEDEVDKLNYVQSYLNHLITSFNNQYINLSSQIEIRQYKR